MGLSTVLKCCYRTMKVLYDKLQPIVMRMQESPAEWKEISDEFEREWQFPHVWGAMDGKHVVMQAQLNSGSSFFNYKGRHSIILLAVCDAQYKFIAVDVGARGIESDGGVLGKRIGAKSLNLPPPSEICHGGPILPFFCLADAAFHLHENIMRSYPGRSTGIMPLGQQIFNYSRGSRGRRTIENAYGIMCSQWRIFRLTIHATTEHIKLIVLPAVVLHNYLRKKEEDCPEDHARNYCPINFCDRINENGIEVAESGDATSKWMHLFPFLV
ncbi:uncharacterized protein LOC127287237 [Leptopilina boulardi]|uniref:uncharacterized protein LOC127287237 n=1 Tax=Leptopilina boulardi TaxID=63433 RepID=UPI0021F58392|nr:uncharacterized protein LOC127287237 [Leptopilina boulardi]